MKITGVEAMPVAVPVRADRAITGARGAHRVSTFVIVTLRTDTDLIGLGEVSSTAVWSGEDHVTATHVIGTYLAPALIGQDARQIDALTQRMARAIAGNSFTKAGVEMALWDLAGKAAGQPLYRLLGGPVRGGVPTKFSISGVAPEAAAELARWAVAQGFGAMKVKVGLGLADDIARVRAVRAAVGPAVKLGIDANGGWSLAETIDALEALRDVRLAFVEQPVAPDDIDGLAEVRGRGATPVIADESVWTAQDARNLIRAGAVDALSVYVGKAGGIGPARAIVEIAHAAGVGVTLGSNLELGIGSAAMIHLALALPGITAEALPCDILTPFYNEHDLLRESLPVVGGLARAIERPGLGVELDAAAVRRYRA